MTECASGLAGCVSSQRTAMGTLQVAIGAAIVASIASALASCVALAYLRRRQVLDRPNERSSHVVPTPRGLGIAVIPVVLTAWLIVGRLLPAPPGELLWVCAGAAALATLSWIDDVRGMPIGPRLLAQFLAVSFGMWAFDGPLVFHQHWLPPLADRCIAGFLWVGLINHVNFADGIDGHLGTKVTCVGIGLFLVAIGGSVAFVSTASLALMLSGACLGFLTLNWHPARGFMGDVGSVPIGFLLGWLLLRTISYGHCAPALILPLFYFTDTAITYARRVPRVRKFWLPHREYLYQRATVRFSHSKIVGAVLACNVALVVLALLAARKFEWGALLAAALPVAATRVYLARGSAKSLEHG